jgi:hypothetical protein
VVAVVGTVLPAAAAPPVVTATLVQTILTSGWNPASPDPSGIVWLPASQRFEVADSEVDETTGAGYHNVNLWQVTPAGVVRDTGTTYTPAPNYSREPTGLGYDPASNTLFVSDDDKKRIFLDKPGSDGRFGNADDVVTSIDVGALGVTDAEDPEFDTTTGNPTSGHLFFLSGAQQRVYEIDPVNGIFGDGNDVSAYFSIGSLASDFEALGSDPVANTLFVGTNTSAKKIFEITKTGTLVRTIDASGISGLKHISGLAYAPSSFNPAVKDFWIVDRQVDNGSNASENDGKMFEIAVPSSSNNPPTVTNPGTMTNAVGDPVSYQIQASDPDGDAISSYGASGLPAGLSVNTSTGLITGTTTAAGSSTVTISATDSKGGTGSTSFTWNVSSNGSVTLNIPISTGSNDAEQKSTGKMTLTSTDLDMMTDGTSVQQAVGLRFTGVTVPQGAQITAAYVQFKADETHNDPTTLVINGERSADAAAFTTARYNVTSRQKTTGFATWTPPGWTAGEVSTKEQTPDLSSVLNEVFSSSNGWASGNSLVLIVTGSGKAVAKSFDSAAANAPVLHIEYTYSP